MTRLAPYAAAFALATASLLVSVPSALACSCAQPPDAAAALDGAALVFEGRLTTGPTEVDGMHHYSFDVVRTFKGDAGGSVLVETRAHGAACGRAYDKTVETFLIYASAFEDGKATDNICTRTRSMTAGADDLAVLGAGVRPGEGKPKAPEAAPESKTDPAGGESTDAGITAAPEGDEVAAEGDEVAAVDAGAAAEPAAAEADPAPAADPEPADAGGDEVKDGCSMAAGGGSSVFGLLLIAGLLRRRA